MVNRAMRNQPMMRTMRIEEIIKIQEEISEKTSGPLYTMVLCMDIVRLNSEKLIFFLWIFFVVQKGNWIQ